MSLKSVFNTVAKRTAYATGTPWTFIAAVAVVVVWGITGPLFGFNDTCNWSSTPEPRSSPS